MTLARAVRTSVEKSDASSWNRGVTLVWMDSAETRGMQSFKAMIAVILTSRCWSLSKSPHTFTRSEARACGRPLQNSTMLRAIWSLTRQDLSVQALATRSTTCSLASLASRMRQRLTRTFTISTRTTSVSSAANLVNVGMISAKKSFLSTTLTKAARLRAAARLTMGVSSLHRAMYSLRSSALTVSVATPYTAGNSMHAEHRGENQSAPDRRRSTGSIVSKAKFFWVAWPTRLLRVLIASSRTRVSSWVPRDSRGGTRVRHSSGGRWSGMCLYSRATKKRNSSSLS
mmetsp:Transcript_40791/g.88851  ORF Transcript_40791/g.88851 Transcript_40791/m.88851 type:complete len:286 (+) Transcript_40791:274-1131(+)